VEMLTGETTKRIIKAQLTPEDVALSALTGFVEPRWYMAEFVPTQIQASPSPLCIVPECAIAGDLVETEIWEVNNGY